MCEAALTQAEMGVTKNGDIFFSFIPTYMYFYDTERHLGTGLLESLEMAVRIALQSR